MYSAFLDDGHPHCRYPASNLLLKEEGRIVLPPAHLLLTHLGCDVTDPLTPKSFGLFYFQTPASSPADTKALRTPQKEPTEQLCADLGSALSSQLPLVQQLFPSQAPVLSCQPVPGVICMSAVLHSSTVQNTSLPTKCLHTANLQYNYFLMPITEALKDEYKSHPHTLWHYIRCEGI